MKKIISIIIVLLLLGAAGYWFFMKKETPPAQTTTEQQKADPNNPTFVSGTVVDATREFIKFKTGTGEYKAIIDPFSTVLYNQVKVNGKTELKAGNFLDFKPGTQILVNFDQQPQNGEYKATKIQTIAK